MPQDAFHIRRLAQELHTFLVGGKINRISQVNKDELTFIIYTGKSTVKLILSANASGARVCLSATEKEPAPVAPNFCMLLRKHLQGAEILEIRQHETERIIEIDLRCASDFSESVRTLRCELMGKYSNILLTEKGIILGALKTSALEDNTHRVLLAGAKYLYPAPQDKLNVLDGAGMRSRLENYLETHETHDTETLAVWLFENVAGLALPTAREIVKRAGNTPLWDFLPDFFLHEPNAPHLKTEGGKPTDFFAFAVDGGLPTPSLCKAEDEYFTGRETKKGYEDKKRKLENALRTFKKKQLKKMQSTLEQLGEAEKAESYRIQGELLTANLYRVEKGAEKILLDNWYDEEGGQITVPLDARLSPAKNAQRLFKLYAKHKRAKEILTPMLKKEEEELAYVDSVLSFVALSENEVDLREIKAELVEMGLIREQIPKHQRKKKEESVPYRRFEKDGFTVLVGRNNIQNDRLLREADGEDLWLHAQKYHSSHVIVVADGREIPDEVLTFAAQLCAYYSEGKEADKLSVDYCKRRFVKKPKGGKLGFVTYTDYKTVVVEPTLPRCRSEE